MTAHPRPRPRPRPAAGPADARVQPGSPPGQGRVWAATLGRGTVRAPGTHRALGPGPTPPPACCRGDGSAVTDGAAAQCPGGPAAVGQWQQRPAARALRPALHRPTPTSAAPAGPTLSAAARAPAPLPAAGRVTRCGKLERRPRSRLPRRGEACRERGRQNSKGRPCLLPAAARTGRPSPARRPSLAAERERPRRDTDPACASGARSALIAVRLPAPAPIAVRVAASAAGVGSVRERGAVTGASPAPCAHARLALCTALRKERSSLWSPFSLCCLLSSLPAVLNGTLFLLL